ncbi:MAG TPA: hypothetical protein VI462_05985 [Acidimicrobiia bacterium]
METSSLIRLHKPGSLMYLWRSDYHHVIIDGVDVGELWPRQTKAIDVNAGEHSIRLRCVTWPIASKTLVLSLKPGEVVKLVCWPNPLALGFTHLHYASPRESIRMKEIVETPRPPRNLGAPSNPE